ncbi:A-kinase anchor protein 12b isoform X3 [Betta splendens]|uniref:A-kinase anchor protein 12b isoform X3 n=1 Tax=Betta splendens TaxID=158456 RepID=A0A6P7LT29_BETSP|nr:A-kinase anchor protein 12b isoform X3 [Betta splendens]
MLGTITLTVGQPDGVSVAQKEEAPEAADSIQGEVAPQLNGEKAEKEAPDASDITVEEKAVEQKPDEAADVGFKKIFRFVGFKFTLKKDKSEEKDPVKLLTVKDKEEEEVGGAEEPAQKEEEASAAEEKSTLKEEEAEAEESTAEAEVTKEETSDAPPEGAADGEVEGEGAEKEEASAPPAQETTVSTFRKLFSGGLFSNLRKKASVKKTKEEEEKESAVEEGAAKAEEPVEKDEKVEVEGETKEEAPQTPKEEKTETKEEVPVVAEEEKSGPKEAPPTAEAQEPEPKEEAKPEPASEPDLTVEPPAAADDTKPEEEKAEKEERAPAEVTSEGELQSSQEKTKPQGSPLKKLFTGAGLKKLSTKKQKNKKETESKLTESGETPAERLQSSTDSAEAPKAESGPSSPEESGEHAVAADGVQNESSLETEGEGASDGEKKKEGIIAWSSFKKLVTPKKRVKRSSESEDEATGDKAAKSATLSSSESAEEETKEEKSTEEEPKTEATEKLVSSAEEPKKKMDTSVSWEALMCMGGPKKRARRTSDSDDDETEKEAPVAPAAEAEQEAKPEVAASRESDGEAATAEPSGASERESTWDTLKRMVMKNRARSEEKPEENSDHVQSDGEAPKDESAFSLRKLFPRKKKKADKQSCTDGGSGEDDSDTPAVVPLSEYDEQEEAEKEAPAEPTAAPAEERTPSWIPANVEGADDKRDQLSDIPEEAENAATPKSVDTDTAGEETPEPASRSPEAPAPTRRRLSTAEVKPLAQASADQTAPVPREPESQTAEALVEPLHGQISQIPPETSVVAEDVPVEAAAEEAEHQPPAENAESSTSSVLEPHVADEAVAICTGLGTKEVAKVALEKPAVPTVEAAIAVRDALSCEVAAEERPQDPEGARAAEDAVHEAQVHLVEATHLEPVVENARSKAPAVQVATQGHEPHMEASGVVTTAAEESLYVQPPAVSENSPKGVIFDPIAPTSEALVCTQSAEVTEPTVETKEVEVEVEQRAASGERAAIREAVQAVSGQVSSTAVETTRAAVPQETEPEIPVAVATEEACVIAETVVIAASHEPATESAPGGEQAAQAEEAALTQTAESAADAAVEQARERVEEPGGEIEAQSAVVAQAVLQVAVEEVSADAREDKEPAATAPAPAQAASATEEDLETESPVVMETPVVSLCQTPAPKAVQTLHVAMEVMDAVPIEVTENLRTEEEEKPEEPKELKQAVEVEVSEDAVVVEEVGETGDGEQEEEEEKETEVEVQEPDVKGAEEEVKEENAEKQLEIHMPVQVVLQSAQVAEAPSVEEEAVVELDGSGPERREEEAAPSAKCAEVMAQVIEVIEEAVKEIEPVSTEITAAS